MRGRANNATFALIAALMLAAGLAIRPPSTRAATVELDNWEVSYASTDGDGLVLTSAFFNNVRVFSRVSLPFVQVNYSQTSNCCTDNFSNAVRRAGPTLVDWSGGFDITSTYCFGQCKPYDAVDDFLYKYFERYKFYASGTWRAELLIYGPGIHSFATYEVLWRVDYDISDPADDVFHEYENGAWIKRTTEATFCDDGANDANGNEWRQSDLSPLRRYSIDPFGSGYCNLVLRYDAGQIVSSGDDYPSIWDNNQSIDTTDIVQWYWGIRQYTRPAGCNSNGAGCTIGYPVYFWGEDSGY
jgi:hypothetical protein